MTETRDLGLLLVATLAWVLFAAYELGGLTLPGWHTVSWLAHQHPWLKVSLTLALATLAPLFYWHASQDIPR